MFLWMSRTGADYRAVNKAAERKLLLKLGACSLLTPSLSSFPFIFSPYFRLSRSSFPLRIASVLAPVLVFFTGGADPFSRRISDVVILPLAILLYLAAYLDRYVPEPPPSLICRS